MLLEKQLTHMVRPSFYNGERLLDSVWDIHTPNTFEWKNVSGHGGKNICMLDPFCVMLSPSLSLSSLHALFGVCFNACDTQNHPKTI